MDPYFVGVAAARRELAEYERREKASKMGPFRRVVKFIRYTTSSGRYEKRWQRLTLHGWVDVKPGDPMPESEEGYPVIQL